jgi:hypothetical protein
MSRIESDFHVKDSPVASSGSPYRVKLYHLQPEGGWTDVGTGNLTCSMLEDINAPALIVVAESDSSVVLLKSKIQVEDIYERQDGL